MRSAANNARVILPRLFIFIRNSFSFAKKNFFHFGLEFTVVGLALLCVAANLMGSEKISTASSNVYLSYLQQHPEWNTKVISKVNTENINVNPEKAGFFSRAQAAGLETTVKDTFTADQEAGKDSAHALLVSTDGVLQKPNFATKDSIQKHEVSDYTVQNGDTVAKIAAQFNVSVQTILLENKLSDTDYIKPGQILKILPVTGVRHTVAAKETIDQIAKKYAVDMETILEFNQIEVPDDIGTGEVLIIPDAKVKTPAVDKTRVATYNVRDVKTANLPANFISSLGDFIWPIGIRNITQYFSSRHKALDISNGQRPQFFAANDGVVELSGWDGAYGRSIVINHGNGVKTRYGHASELYVTAGDQVTKGQVIGRVGNTGRVYGATGNHLHFEIIKNGTKVDPLKVMR